MNDSQYITAFHTYLLTEKRVARNTFQAYESDIRQFMSFVTEKERTLITLKGSDVKAYARSLHKRGCKPRTMARKISAIKVLYAFLYDQYQVTDISDVLTIPKIEKNLPVYLSEEEVISLLHTAQADSSVKGQRNFVMLHLLYASGMRVSELVSLCIDQFHFDTGFVTIYGKGGKQRDVPLPMPVCEMIQEYISTIRPQLIEKDDGRSNAILFPSGKKSESKHITRQTFWLVLKHLLTASGITKEVSPHTLRHSLATHLLQAGADIRSLQLWLGHEQMSTVEIYTHLEKSKVRSTYDLKHPRA